MRELLSFLKTRKNISVKHSLVPVKLLMLPSWQYITPENIWRCCSHPAWWKSKFRLGKTRTVETAIRIFTDNYSL